MGYFLAYLLIGWLFATVRIRQGRIWKQYDSFRNKYTPLRPATFMVWCLLIGPIAWLLRGGYELCAAIGRALTRYAEFVQGPKDPDDELLGVR